MMKHSDFWLLRLPEEVKVLGSVSTNNTNSGHFYSAVSLPQG